MSGIVGGAGSKSGVIGQSEIDIDDDGWLVSLDTAVDIGPSDAVLQFDGELHIGSNITYSSGRVTVARAGWYFCSFDTHNNGSTDTENQWRIIVDGSTSVYQPSGGTAYHRNYIATASAVAYPTAGTLCSVIRLNAGGYAEVKGTGNLYAPASGSSVVAMTWFLGYRLGT